MKRNSFRTILNFILIAAMLSTHLTIFAVPLAVEDVMLIKNVKRRTFI